MDDDFPDTSDSSRHRAVPSSRVARLGTFGRLAGGVRLSMAAAETPPAGSVRLPIAGAETPPAKQQRERIVTVPPGKLGARIVAGPGGHRVEYLLPDSPLTGHVVAGDVVAAVDEVCTISFTHSQLVELIGSRSESTRQHARQLEHCYR